MPDLTEEEYKLLIKLFKQQNLPRLMDKPQDDVTTHRTVVLYDKHHKEFAKFCKTNKIKQVDALYLATKMFMETFNPNN